jgi:hypothetical protein
MKTTKTKLAVDPHAAARAAGRQVGEQMNAHLSEVIEQKGAIARMLGADITSETMQRAAEKYFAHG